MVVCACCSLVVVAALLFGKTKTPPPVWQWGSIKLVNESEPNRRAAQPQRVQQSVLRSNTAEGGQVKIQMATHGYRITIRSLGVKLIFTLASIPPPPGNWRFMAWKHKISGGIMATIGFWLSPLSWWNDAFVNIPLALVFAWLVSFFYKPAFTASLIVGYWLTNVLGLVLLHKGTRKLLSEKPPPEWRRELLKDVIVSLVYTGFIIALIKLGLLKPFTGYLTNDQSL
jgi:hypothetical protein